MLPPEFIEEIRAVLGDETQAFLDAQNMPAVSALRINPLKAGAESAAERFCARRVPWEDTGRYIALDTRPGASVAHAAGAFYIQDASAMAPVAALEPLPGDIVLDMCAAPGGKSSQIAGRLMGEGALVANEYVKSRAEILRRSLERLGVKNAIVTSASPERFEGLGHCFDKILVDAPCSGEGMFRKDPGAIDEWRPDLPAACALRQGHILDSAFRALKPGGRLVYSTCTFNRTENEDVIQAFLSRHAEMEPEDFSLPGIGASEKGCLRLWPQRIKGEGHFVCRLKRRGNAESRPLVPVFSDKTALAVARQLGESCLKQLPRGVYRLRGDVLACESPYFMDLGGIYTLMRGLEMGRVSKGRIEPAHALALATEPENALNTFELSESQAIAYLAGEALECSGAPGWTLAVYKGLSLGWGKVSNGTFKNHYPKGLRLRGGHALKQEDGEDNGGVL